MKTYTRSLIEEDIRDLSGWRYAAPYDIYHQSGEKLLHGKYRALCDENRRLVGFFCWAEEARVPAATALYEADSAALDFGIGLRPEMTGRGLGLAAVECALAWLREAHCPPKFRLAVYEWNERAQRVYWRAGFRPLTKRGDFLIMTCDDRPFREATRPLEPGIVVYPEDPPFQLITRTIHGWRISELSMNVHTGTHVDAPAHVGLPGGTDGLSLRGLNGSVQLLNWKTPDFEAIRAPRVLLKHCEAGLTAQEAKRIIDLGVSLLGMDRLSVGEGQAEWEVHRLLLEHHVIIVENIALEQFQPGWYEMRCLPVLLPGSDGAPVRLLLREESF